jgi:hypothetical protein
LNVCLQVLAQKRARMLLHSEDSADILLQHKLLSFTLTCLLQHRQHHPQQQQQQQPGQHLSASHSKPLQQHLHQPCLPLLPSACQLLDS